MFNVCYCGATAGFLHRPDCPRPLFRASDIEAANWTAARDKKREQIANDTTAEDNNLLGLHPISSDDYAALCNATNKISRIASDLVWELPEPRRSEVLTTLNFYEHEITVILAGY